VQRDRQRAELPAVDVPADQPVQARVGHEVVTRSEEAQQPDDRIQREDLPAPQPQLAPDPAQGIGRRDGLWPRRDERPIERTGRRPDDHVRSDAALVQGAQHPDLYRSQARPAREDERHVGLLMSCHTPSASAAR
jgi:hypothetical protein